MQPEGSQTWHHILGRLHRTTVYVMQQRFTSTPRSNDRNEMGAPADRPPLDNGRSIRPDMEMEFTGPTDPEVYQAAR